MRVLTALSLFAFASVFAGCAVDGTPEKLGQSEDEIIGGVPAYGTALDAVGSLVIVDRTTGTPTYSPVCSATLIGKTAVLTAEHCTVAPITDYELAFAIGPDARAPKETHPIAEIERETTVTGGGVGLGSDVAILHLGTPVKGIKPLAIGTIDPSKDLERSFVAVGYGMQNESGIYGTRYAGGMKLKGLSGSPAALEYGTKEAFVAALVAFYHLSDADLADPATQDAIEQMWSLPLLEGYEGFFGVEAGDAQACHGDSGGPMIGDGKGGRKVYGVASWVLFSNGSTFCGGGSAYALFGPATQTFIEKALTWVDPCDGIAVEGVCKKNEAVRCTGPGEGERRLTKTNCKTLGMACGIDPTGHAACVDK